MVRSFTGLFSLGVLLLGLCVLDLAAEESVQIGDTQARVREIMGNPRAKMKSRGVTELFYADGNIALRDGKVVEINLLSDKRRATKTKTSRNTSSATPATTRATRSVEPTVSSPPTQSELNSLIPRYSALARSVRDTARKYNVSFIPEEMHQAIYDTWRNYGPKGGKSPHRTMKDELRFYWLKHSPKVPFESDNKAEYRGGIKVKRGGNWEYLHRLPEDGAGITEAYKKYATAAQVGSSVSGNILTTYTYGSNYTWYRIYWHQDTQSWHRLSCSQRTAFQREYSGKLKQRIAKAKKEADRPVYDAGYRNIRSVVNFHGSHFRHRALDQFLRDFSKMEWPKL